MTDIEQKALALVNEVQADWNYQLGSLAFNRDRDAFCEALCRAIEQHEAFRQEVSDAVSKAIRFCKDGRPASAAGAIGAFVIPAPKPDPLVEIIGEINDGPYVETRAEYADRIRAALDKLGFEIREKNDV